MAALRTAKRMGSVEPFTVVIVFVYVACLGAMVIGNVLYEGGLTEYILVQTVGLIVVSGLALVPLLGKRRAAGSDSSTTARVEPSTV